MDSKFLQGGMRMLARARQSGQLGFACLVKPPVREDGRTTAHGNGWCLRGEVHPKMLAAMRANGIQGQKGLLVTLANGHGFYVLTQQSGVLQHRFVLALEGSLVRQCLQDCQSQRLQLSFNSLQERKSLVTSCTPHLPGVEALPGDDVDSSDYLYEQAALVMHMLLVQAVRIEGMPIVEDVCVSVVQTSGNHADLQADLQLHALLANLVR